MWLYVCTKRKVNSKGTKIASLSLPRYMHRIVSLLRQGTRRFVTPSCLDFGAFRNNCLLSNTHLDIDEKVSIHFCLKAIFPSPFVVEQIFTRAASRMFLAISKPDFCKNNDLGLRLALESWPTNIAWRSLP